MKKIEDYLHLYLGCQVWEKGGHPVKLTREYVYKHDTIDSNIIKPILRPLSDMTEEEAKELEVFIQPFIDRMDDDNHIISSGEVDAERTRWALSKHFDLFGLIESGLAIDATKIKDEKDCPL